MQRPSEWHGFKLRIDCFSPLVGPRAGHCFLDAAGSMRFLRTSLQCIYVRLAIGLGPSRDSPSAEFPSSSTSSSSWANSSLGEVVPHRASSIASPFFENRECVKFTVGFQLPRLRLEHITVYPPRYCCIKKPQLDFQRNADRDRRTMTTTISQTRRKISLLFRLFLVIFFVATTSVPSSISSPCEEGNCGQVLSPTSSSMYPLRSPQRTDGPKRKVHGFPLLKLPEETLETTVSRTSEESDRTAAGGTLSNVNVAVVTSSSSSPVSLRRVSPVPPPASPRPPTTISVHFTNPSADSVIEKVRMSAVAHELDRRRQMVHEATPKPPLPPSNENVTGSECAEVVCADISSSSKTRKSGCLHGCVGSLQGFEDRSLNQVIDFRDGSTCTKYCAGVASQPAIVASLIDGNGTIEAWTRACEAGCEAGYRKRPPCLTTDTPETTGVSCH